MKKSPYYHVFVFVAVAFVSWIFLWDKFIEVFL